MWYSNLQNLFYKHNTLSTSLLKTKQSKRKNLKTWKGHQQFWNISINKRKEKIKQTKLKHYFNFNRLPVKYICIIMYKCTSSHHTLFFLAIDLYFIFSCSYVKQNMPEFLYVLHIQSMLLRNINTRIKGNIKLLNKHKLIKQVLRM